MYPTKGSKTVVSLLGTGVTNGATVTANIDTLGFDHVTVNVITGTADVVSDTPSVLKFTEADVTNATSFVAITNLTGGTLANTSGFFVLPNTDTSLTTVANVFRFDIDTRARKRYLQLAVSPRTTQQVVMVATLDRAAETAGTTAAQGTHLTVNA
ncbi:MAG TPA: hypothetical protein VKI17_10635 [Gemmataceae bacterium]|nr:hypothetical protein [Gemmataceae bacterium]